MATIKAGTYVFVESPTITEAYNQTLNYKAHYLTAENVYATDTYNAIRLSVTVTWGGSVAFRQTENTTDYPVTGYAGNLKHWQSVLNEESGNLTATDNTKLRTIIIETDQTVTDNFYTWFTANTVLQPKLSVDLTTLSGWANLSAGNHTIKIKAKGTGYKESELSAGVVVSKAAGETWVLNDSDALTESNQDFTSLNFTSDSQSFVRIVRQYDNRPIPPVNSLLYYKSDGTYATAVYTNDDGIAFWNRQAYRTLTFTTPPTGDLLTWLQANGTKQATGYNVTVTYSYQGSGDWSGLAYYSIDDGATWIDLYDSTNPATKTIENITQIKFKSYKDSVGNYSYISGSGDLSGISFGNPWQGTDEVSANVVLTQNSSVNISYGD